MKAQTFLIKPASGNCNMRCKYCFYCDVAESRTVKSYGVMSLETLETIVRRALEEVTVQCCFAFQGGEPTLAGLDFYRRLIGFERKYNQNGVKITHALQTNGLLLDDEWCAFFAEHKFLIGLSIDGEKAVHDELRPDAADKGTHNRCLKAARLMRSHGVDFNILSVVTRRLAAHPVRAWQFYKREGFSHLQFIPCLDGLGEAPGKGACSLDAKRYGDFMFSIFDQWYDDYTHGKYISVRAFDNYIGMLAGHPPEDCAMMGRCTAYPLIEADGGVYPCDFYALDEYRLGDVAEHSFADMLTGDAARRFVAPSLAAHPDCMECGYYFICRGGCRRDSEPIPADAPAKSRFCESYKRFFGHALARMRALSHHAIRF